MNFSESFLFQTAKDYDIDLETVKEIAKKLEEKFIENFKMNMKLLKNNI